VMHLSVCHAVTPAPVPTGVGGCGFGDRAFVHGTGSTSTTQKTRSGGYSCRLLSSCFSFEGSLREGGDIFTFLNLDFLSVTLILRFYENFSLPIFLSFFRYYRHLFGCCHGAGAALGKLGDPARDERRWPIFAEDWADAPGQ
jgi:hypothetical protein